MATIKLKFRKSSVEGKNGVLFYQVIHRRVVRQVNSGRILPPSCWNPDTESIVVPACADSQMYMLGRLVSADLKRLREIADLFERSGKDYTADMIVGEFNKSGRSVCFLSFGCNLVAGLKSIGKERTAISYAKAMSSLCKFLGGSDIFLNEFDSMFVSSYGEYLKARGLCPNTVAYYMRNLRAMYNRAVDRGVTDQQFPFKNIRTGIENTVKRAVSISTVRRIKNADLYGKGTMELARDLFVFSFYTRGMSFVDIAFLRKSDLSGGVLTYRRRKTGQQLFIRWEKCMQEIVNRHPNGSSEYLLPIITDRSKDPWAQYISMSRLVNAKLKKLGRSLGLLHPLTMYVARHSWASAAQSKSIPLSVISRCMGHDSEKTTKIYLASLDNSAIDEANMKVLKSIF